MSFKQSICKQFVTESIDDISVSGVFSASLIHSLMNRTRRSISTLSTFPTNDLIFNWPESLIGPDWHGNPYRNNALFAAFSPLEPQFTKSLAYYLLPCDQEKAEARVRTFINSLLLVTKRQESPDSSYEKYEPIHQLQCFDVIAEEPIKEGNYTGRIDLWIDWQATGSQEKHLIIIEAKFDAPLSEGQLTAYSKAGKRWEEKWVNKKNKAKWFGVYLAPDNREFPSETKKKPWPQFTSKWGSAGWMAVMKEWEKSICLNNKLKNDKSQAGIDFHRFRRSIWDKTLL